MLLKHIHSYNQTLNICKEAIKQNRYAIQYVHNKFGGKLLHDNRTVRNTIHIKKHVNEELIKSFKHRIIKHRKGPYLEEICISFLNYRNEYKGHWINNGYVYEYLHKYMFRHNHRNRRNYRKGYHSYTLRRSNRYRYKVLGKRKRSY